jgi:hypothetical protein
LRGNKEHLESRIDALEEKLDEDRNIFDLLRVVRQWAEDGKNHVEGKMTDKQYSEKLEKILMRELKSIPQCNAKTLTSLCSESCPEALKIRRDPLGVRTPRSC